MGDGTGSMKFSSVFAQERDGKIDEYYKMGKSGLGEGSYGSVTTATNKTSGNKYAVKTIGFKDKRELAKYLGEVEVHKALDHPHIVKLHEVFQDSKKLYLVMELCTGGELFDRILEAAEAAADAGNEGQAFTEKDASIYMLQIFGAMRYLHSHNCAHRDIKPENFLLHTKERDAPIKVIDFGLAKKFEANVPMTTKAGTPYYVAPEVLSGAYDEKCDVWSCGVILYILLCGYPPFYGDKNEEIISMVKKGKIDFPSPDWDTVTKDGKDLILHMTTMDPKKRPSFETLMGHRWLHDHTPKSTHTIDIAMADRLKKWRTKGKFEKLALNCIAHQLKDQDIEDLKKTFEALDLNRDGTLTTKEIVEGMETHKCKLPADFMDTIKTLDTDGSGVVEYSEFIAATVKTKQYAQESTLWAAFRTFDADGNGQISRAELQSFMQQSDDASLTAMIKEADIDGDGNISFDEFKTLMLRDS
eukprot:TRINITY_DN90461_c0_g1_i1.p1 TRINITY_DN90461_c0_g1~~TRINITY_DN90461_c0_g1_i1.p1  ORF type:complete len:472 (+),score=139.66 TRINITY_DN90461_c0_g1_i1:93-1508(+)